MAIGKRILAGGDISVSRTLRRGAKRTYQSRSGPGRAAHGRRDDRLRLQRAHVGQRPGAAPRRRDALRRRLARAPLRHADRPAQLGARAAAQAAQDRAVPQQPRRARGANGELVRAFRPGGPTATSTALALTRAAGSTSRGPSRRSAGAGATALPPSAHHRPAVGDVLAAAAPGADAINALLADGARVFAAGSFAGFGDVPRANLAIFAADGAAGGSALRRGGGGTARRRPGAALALGRGAGAAVAALPAGLPDASFGTGGLAAGAVRQPARARRRSRSGPTARITVAGDVRGRAASARSSPASPRAGALDPSFAGSGSAPRSLRRGGRIAAARRRDRRRARRQHDRRGRRRQRDHGRALPARRRARRPLRRRRRRPARSVERRRDARATAASPRSRSRPAARSSSPAAPASRATIPTERANRASRSSSAASALAACPTRRSATNGFTVIQLGARSARRPARSQVAALVLGRTGRSSSRGARAARTAPTAPSWRA